MTELDAYDPEALGAASPIDCQTSLPIAKLLRPCAMQSAPRSRRLTAEEDVLQPTLKKTKEHGHRQQVEPPPTLRADEGVSETDLHSVTAEVVSSSSDIPAVPLIRGGTKQFERRAAAIDLRPQVAQAVKGE